MVKYTYCPVKIPKKGDKLKTIGGHVLFFRVAKNLIEVYETTTGVLVLVTQKTKGVEFAESFISKNIERVERFVNEENSKDKEWEQYDGSCVLGKC